MYFVPRLHEAVTGKVGVLDDIILLVVMAQDQQNIAELFAASSNRLGQILI